MKNSVKRFLKYLLIIYLLFIAILYRNKIKDSVFRLFTPEVKFENSAIEFCAYALQGFSSRTIREYDLKNVEDLYVESMSESENSLEDLKYFSNLKRLTVEETDNEGIKEIGKCTSLEILTIGGDFTDLKSLSDLINLKFLNIRCNYVKDLSPLGDLTQLEQLGIAGNHVENIDFLRNLNNLEILILWYMYKLIDISPIEDLNKLVRLDLENISQLENIKFISELTNLRNLRILDCPKVTDISAIKNLNNIEILQLASTGITDISVLGNLTEYPKLIRLALDDEVIKDQEQLRTIRNEIDKRDRSNSDFYWKYDWLRSNYYKKYIK